MAQNLELTKGNCTSGVLAGKNIRKELKAKYPMVKFSVVKRYYGIAALVLIFGLIGGCAK